MRKLYNVAVVSGTRDITRLQMSYVAQRFRELAFILGLREVVHGGARGVDMTVDRVARDMGLDVTEALPDYSRYPARVAPLRRNETMINLVADNPEACLIAFWDGKSAGTRHTIVLAAAANLPTVIIYLPREPIVVPPGQTTL